MEELAAGIGRALESVRRKGVPEEEYLEEHYKTDAPDWRIVEITDAAGVAEQWVQVPIKDIDDMAAMITRALKVAPFARHRSACS